MSLLPDDLRRIVQLSSEKGASSWLSVLPIEEYGFALHKGAFRDALCLRYGWLPSGLPAKCVCGHGFTVDHAMNCSSGGFPTLCHNELGDSPQLYCVLSEVCNDVAVEPVLQPLSGKSLRFATANVEDEARLDVSTRGFWGGNHQRTFLMYVFLTLWLQVTVLQQCLHCTGILSMLSRECMNNV